MSLEHIDIQCPYCGEIIDIQVEKMDEPQEFISDCSVCCRPIQFEASVVDGELDVSASRSD
jgi:hypothetical protein